MRFLTTATLAAALAFGAPFAIAAPPSDLDTYVLLGVHGLRTKGIDAINGNIGVNDGILRARGAIHAPRSAVVADVAQFRDPSTCSALFANETVAPTCAPPTSLRGELLADPAAACGFEPIEPCAGGIDTTIDKQRQATLDPGTYGVVRVRQGGVLRLRAGRYHLCGLRLDRNATLLANGPVRVDVAGTVKLGDDSRTVPATGTAVGQLQIFVAGARVQLQRNAALQAELCAPDGTFSARSGATIQGRVVARLIRTAEIDVARSRCGDGHAEGDEECDGTDVRPCPDGSASGALLGTCPVCRTDCTLDDSCCADGTTTTTSTSTTITTTTTSTRPPECGDGVREGAEECDGTDLGGALCDEGSAESAVLDDDTCPVCTPDCHLDRRCCAAPSTTTTTTPPQRCGNGVREGDEECDGSDLGDVVCGSPLGAFTEMAPCAACRPDCTIDRSCCPIPTTTSTTLPLGVPEICDDCVDNDGNGLVDFDDPACCAQPVGTTLKRGRIRPRGELSGLKLRGRVVSGEIARVDSTRTGVQVQITERTGRNVLCAQVPGSRIVFKRKKRLYLFRDKAGAVAGAKGLDKVALRLGKAGRVSVRVRGKNAHFRTPAPGRLTVTLGFLDPTPGHAANQCAQMTQSFRVRKRGALRFP
ncbi:MAG: hypothetical protein U0807_03380 [Candidatus Binatia bacterium]